MSVSRLSGREFVRYLVTGGVNAVLTFAVYSTGLYVIYLNYLVSLVVAFLTGVVFTYVVNFLWVFRPESKLVFRRRFLQYLISMAGSFIINLATLYYFVEYLGLDPFFSQVCLMIPIVIANFLLAKYWSLKGAASGYS